LQHFDHNSGNLSPENNQSCNVDITNQVFLQPSKSKIYHLENVYW